MKKLLPYIVLFICISSFGQDTIDTTIKIPLEKLPTAYFEARLTMNYGSTNLGNEFVQKLLFGGRIGDDLKDKSLDKINKTGRFGIEINYNAKYINLKDTLFYKLPNYNYYIEFGSYNNVSSSYSKDLFSTVFYGNKQFENTTAELGNSNLTSTKFEKITVGLISRDFKTSYGVSLIIGGRINSYDIKKAAMFTHTDGTSISMDYEGSVKLSNSESDRDFMAFNGAGIGLDYSTLLFNSKYSFSVTNFGFTIWSKNTKYSNTAEQYEFEGVEIDNILKLTSKELELNAKEILPELENKPFFSMLPTIFRFDKNFNSKLRLQSIYGIRYKLLSNYLPSAYGGISYQATSNLRLVGSVAYGGYSKLRGGFGAYYKYKNLFTGVESSNITGIFMKDGNGNGLGLFCSYYF